MDSKTPPPTAPLRQNEIRRVFLRINLSVLFGWLLFMVGLVVFSVQQHDGLGFSAGLIAGCLVTGGGLISFFGPLWQIYVKITRFSNGKPG